MKKLLVALTGGESGIQVLGRIEEEYILGYIRDECILGWHILIGDNLNDIMVQLESRLVLQGGGIPREIEYESPSVPTVMLDNQLEDADSIHVIAIT